MTGQKTYHIETRYEIHDGTFTGRVPNDIKNVAGFVEWLTNDTFWNQDGNTLTISRIDHIINPDLAIDTDLFRVFHSVGDLCLKPKVIVGQGPVRKVVLHVRENVLYKSDAIEYFKQKGIDEKMEHCDAGAVVIPWISEERCVGLRNSITGAPTEYTLTHHGYDVLNPERDVVVNSKVQELWPNKGSKIPVALRELFARQK